MRSVVIAIVLASVSVASAGDLTKETDTQMIVGPTSVGVRASF